MAMKVLQGKNLLIVKKVSLFLLALGSCFLSASAQDLDRYDYGTFNHLAVGVSASTNGFGLEASTCLTSYLGIRAGVHVLPGMFKTKSDLEMYDGSTYGEATSTLKRTTAEILLDVYPFVGGFFVTGGLSFGGGRLISIEGKPDDYYGGVSSSDFPGDVVIDDYLLPLNANNELRAYKKVNNVRPYLGIGFGGRCVPKSRLSMRFEMGVQFQGKAKLLDYNKNQAFKLSETKQDDYDYDYDDSFLGLDSPFDLLTKHGIYPVIKFTLNGRIF